VCGRYASTKDPATLAVEFDALDATESEAPGADYNVAPTKPVLAIVARHPRDVEGKPDPDAVVTYLKARRIEFTTWWGWRNLDAYERALGAPYERERIKVVDRPEMITASRLDLTIHSGQ